MKRADIVERRLAAQCISATAFIHPAEVVARLGAVQAQDYLGALWAIGLRMKAAREEDVERALAERTIVRTWPMRGTLHFVAAADVRWMVGLLGPKVLARAAGRLEALGLDDATIARARRVLVKRLEGGRALARPEVYGALERANVSTAGQRGIHILWRLAHEGVLCFGARQGKQQSFVLLDDWVPGAKPLSRDEALAELARRYFTGHGPATAADFAWWSGLSPADARLAIRLAAHHLHEDTLDGAAHWFSRSSEPPPAPQAHRHRAYLLPAFDEFIVGYTDRGAVLDPRRAVHVNAGGGVLNPAIVAGGRIVGTWKRRFVRDRVAFSPAPFAPLSQSKERAVAQAFERYAAFLGVGVA